MLAPHVALAALPAFAVSALVSKALFHWLHTFGRFSVGGVVAGWVAGYLGAWQALFVLLSNEPLHGWSVFASQPPTLQRRLLLVAATFLLILFASGCSKVSDERSAAYKAACEGQPLRTVEMRHKALEDGFNINQRYDCIDRESFAAVSEARAKWEAAHRSKPADDVDTSQSRSGRITAAFKKQALEQRSVSGADFDQLYKAIIGILGVENLVDQTEKLCGSALPTSAKMYSDAADRWRQRNADTVEKARRIASESFTTFDRQSIDVAVDMNNRWTLAGVVNAPFASKIKWCDQSAAETNSGALSSRAEAFLMPSRTGASGERLCRQGPTSNHHLFFVNTLGRCVSGATLRARGRRVCKHRPGNHRRHHHP